MKKSTIAQNVFFILLVLLVMMAWGCSTNDDALAPPEPEEIENTSETEEPEETEEVEAAGEAGEPETEEVEETEEAEENEQGEEVEPLPNIVARIETSDELSLFAKALTKTDLPDTLNGDGPFTVFAPTDAAVEQLFVLLGDDYNSFDDFNNVVERQILNEILLSERVCMIFSPNGGVTLIIKPKSVCRKRALHFQKVLPDPLRPQPTPPSPGGN